MPDSLDLHSLDLLIQKWRTYIAMKGRQDIVDAMLAARERGDITDAHFVECLIVLLD